MINIITLLLSSLVEKGGVWVTVKPNMDILPFMDILRVVIILTPIVLGIPLHGYKLRRNMYQTPSLTLLPYRFKNLQTEYEIY